MAIDNTQPINGPSMPRRQTFQEAMALSQMAPAGPDARRSALRVLRDPKLIRMAIECLEDEEVGTLPAALLMAAVLRDVEIESARRAAGLPTPPELPHPFAD
jgi:hypothetical protein